jgi:hypothetical protein
MTTISPITWKGILMIFRRSKDLLSSGFLALAASRIALAKNAGTMAATGFATNAKKRLARPRYARTINVFIIREIVATMTSARMKTVILRAGASIRIRTAMMIFSARAIVVIQK